MLNEVVELEIKHVLLFVIVAFLLYHLIGGCRCGDGFSVGIPSPIPPRNCKDLTEVDGCTESVAKKTFEKPGGCDGMCKNLDKTQCKNYKYNKIYDNGEKKSFQCQWLVDECNPLSVNQIPIKCKPCLGKDKVCVSTLNCCDPPPPTKGEPEQFASCVAKKEGDPTGICKWSPRYQDKSQVA